MDIEKKMIIDELQSSIFLKAVATSKAQRFPKSAETSERARKEGNKLYVRNDHTDEMHGEILKFYSKSIILAPNSSEELALGFGNRSALLLHLQRYKECILDVDRALAITKSSALKEKLFNRKMECLSLINLSEEEKSQICINESQSKSTKEKDKPCLGDLLNHSLQEPCSSSLSEDKKSLLKNFTKKEKEDSFNSVAVRYNEKYGRHLVATRDIKPGEIIFVEKPYVACVNMTKPYIHCCHCLSVAWAGIPCEHCGCFIFCSEKCRSEAWEQYHDIECYCISRILYYLVFIHNELKEKICFDGLSIRALVKGLREAGSLEKLKTEVQFIDKCTDKRTRGFSKDGKFENNKFRSLYGLSSEISSHEMKSHVTFSALTLICIARYTSFFGKDFEFCQPEKLAKNPDVVFVGALLLRLSKISNINSHGIVNVNDNCKYSNDLVSCRKNWCCVKGVCIVPLASLTNNSCNPNARRCFSEQQHFILYSLQPIKRHSQIYDSYYCTFFETPNPYRQNILQENFNFKCDCIACVQNWPAWPIFHMNFEELSRTIKMNAKETAIWERYKEVIQSVEMESARYNESLLRIVAKAVEYSIKHLGQPSVITYKLILTLMRVFEELYGYELQTYGECRIRNVP